MDRTGYSRRKWTWLWSWTALIRAVGLAAGAPVTDGVTKSAVVMDCAAVAMVRARVDVGVDCLGILHGTSAPLFNPRCMRVAQVPSTA